MTYEQAQAIISALQTISIILIWNGVLVSLGFIALVWKRQDNESKQK